MEEKRTSNMGSYELPPIQNLLDNSWKLFKKSLLGLFLIDVVTLSAYVMLAFLIFLFTIFLLTLGGNNVMLTTFVVVIFTILALAGVFLVILTSQNAMILTVNSSGRLPLDKSLKKGLLFVVPLFLAHLLTGFLEVGGFMLFIIPGIVFSFFFIFVSFEVVIENRHWIHALRRSFAIVEKHFGEILVRILVIVGIYLAIGVFVPRLLLRIDNSMGVLVFFISFFVNILLKWYTLCYNITLYKQAKAVTDEKHEKGIFWIALVSVLGWVIGLIILSALLSVVNLFLQKDLFYRRFHPKLMRTMPFTAQNISPTPALIY